MFAPCRVARLNTRVMVQSTHRNVTSNLQMSSSMNDWLVNGQDVSLAVLPMFHIYVSWI
jgi:acyl-CoA synthetase (AMP-forming)/AMP-acid ligase II